MNGTSNSCGESSAKGRDLLVCLLLVTATLAVYWQVLNYDFVNFDDTDYVIDNPHVTEGLTLKNILWAFTTSHASNWHPLTWLSHMLDSQLYGMHAGRHHATNLLLHIANSLLLFFVFKRMTGYSWRSGFVAALFALHPLHVESVAWVSERKDVLSAFFWMLTMWCYVRYVEHQTLGRYLWLVLFFVLGLTSKPMLITLPFVFLLLDFYPLFRSRFRLFAGANNSSQGMTVLALVREKVPLFVLVAISSFVTFYAQKQGGAVASLDYIPVSMRIANTLVTYATYIGKMLYPFQLAVFYPHPGMLAWWEIAGACLLLVFLSLMAMSVMRRSPYVAVGWFWYLGTLVPVVGLVQVGRQSMADRYTYIPLIGLFFIIVWGVSEITMQWRYRKRWLATAGSALVLALMTVTWKQVGYWENSITLFKHALEVTTNNYVSHNNLGLTLYNQGRTAEAIRHYDQALEIRPDYAEAHYNLGNALQKQGRGDEAIDHYLLVLRSRPDHVEARINLAGSLQKKGRTEEAIHHYLLVLQNNPDVVEAYINLGVALEEQGRIDDAVSYYRQALQLRPDYAGGHYILGNTLYDQGRTEEAVDCYLQALRLRPDYAEARNNLGVALIRKGDIKGAIAQFRRVLQIQPGHIGARNNLHRALQAQKNQ